MQMKRMGQPDGTVIEVPYTAEELAEADALFAARAAAASARTADAALLEQRLNMPINRIRAALFGA